MDQTVTSNEHGNRKGKKNTRSLVERYDKIFKFVPNSVARFDIYSHMILTVIQMACLFNWTIFLAYCSLSFVYFFDLVVLLNLSVCRASRAVSVTKFP